MVQVVRNYDREDTVFITCIHETYSFGDDTWTESDPDATFPKITIIDPEGNTEIDAATMSRTALGKFQYSYTLAADATSGWWRCWIAVENGSYPDRKPFGFKVQG